MILLAAHPISATGKDDNDDNVCSTLFVKKAEYVERDGDLFWATLRLENEN